jgi:dCMP deaminase
MSKHNEYFMKICFAVAERATCDRAHVGCVLVLEGHIISTGFNGSPIGQPHCDEAGHEMKDGHCIRTVHAEANALIQAALHGTITKGATAYITHFPCYACAKMLVNAGIVHVVFHQFYEGGNAISTGNLFTGAGIGVGNV